MLDGIRRRAVSVRDYLRLTPDARRERRRDLWRGLGDDPGIDRAVEESVAWLCRAQDHSATADGGVARDYSLIAGWGPSYPETTGYIASLFLELADDLDDPSLRERARRMLDWLITLRLPGGGYGGGTVERARGGPAVTFNTGQILIGLAAGADRLGERYLEPMHEAASWLVASQDADGGWRRHPSPYARSPESTFDTHVAWGLLEAGRVGGAESYTEAALRNVRWALGRQAANGWFAGCCLSDSTRPLTHTLGYALRGVVEAWRHTADGACLEGARRAAWGLLTALDPVSGFLPGRLDRSWRGTVPWACLTGSVQIAGCWLLLYRETGDTRLRDAAYAANAFVRRTVAMDGGAQTRGAVKGSFPVSGEYGGYRYPNWAARFFIESNLLEREVRGVG